jgi:chromosome segregation ATPase
MQFIAGASAVIGLLILVGGAIALVRGSYNKARIQALREDNDDLRARLDDCDKKINDHEQRETIMDGKIEHLQSENYILTQMITQRANVAEVVELLQEHHLQTTENWKKILGMLAEMRNTHE